MENSTKRLIPFLRNLADSIENETISQRRCNRVGEFYMSYQFQEQALDDDINVSTNIDEYSPDELMKFIILGWWIYCMLLKNKQLPCLSESDDEPLFPK